MVAWNVGAGPDGVPRVGVYSLKSNILSFQDSAGLRIMQATCTRVPPQAAQEGLPKCGDRFRAPLSQTGTKSVTTFDFCIFGSLEAFTAMNPRKLLERMRLKILEHPVLPPSLVPAFNNIKGWGGCGGYTPDIIFFPWGG